VHSLFFLFAQVLLRDEQDVIECRCGQFYPTSGGCAVFLGNNEKVFIIYVDQTVAAPITMFMRHITKDVLSLMI